MDVHGRVRAIVVHYSINIAAEIKPVKLDTLWIQTGVALYKIFSSEGIKPKDPRVYERMASIHLGPRPSCGITEDYMKFLRKINITVEIYNECVVLKPEEQEIWWKRYSHRLNHQIIGLGLPIDHEARKKLASFHLGPESSLSSGLYFDGIWKNVSLFCGDYEAAFMLESALPEQIRLWLEFGRKICSLFVFGIPSKDDDAAIFANEFLGPCPS